MKVTRSKSGLPTLTENGGGMTNTGYATIVCGADGQKLEPLFIPRGYSNGDHAIFVVNPGQTHLIRASRSRSGESVVVERAIDIDGDDNLEVDVVGEYENGDGNIPSKFRGAVDAALKKCRDYHCRSAHYIQGDQTE
jgi:hypothetical protein